jgi:hypothetical protein
VWEAVSEAVSTVIVHTPELGANLEKRGNRLIWRLNDRSLDWPEPYAYLSAVKRGPALPDSAGRICRGHGDLHGDNVLVDQEGHTWVIDFEHTGFGPPLQDAVELESSIRFNLLEESNLSALLQMEEALAMQENLDADPELLADIDRADRAALWKGAQVILAIRKEASQIPEARLADYLLGLIYQALRTIQIERPPNPGDGRPPLFFRVHALFVASACCAQLEQLGQQADRNADKKAAAGWT